MTIQTLVEIFFPIKGRDGFQSLHDISKAVRAHPGRARNLEKCLREVIQRLPVASELAYARVDIEPEQLAFGVVILRALPRQPGQGPASRNEWLLSGVLKGPPGAPLPVAVHVGGKTCP